VGNILAGVGEIYFSESKNNFVSVHMKTAPTRRWTRHHVVSIPTCAHGRSQSVADAGRGKPLGLNFAASWKRAILYSTVRAIGLPPRSQFAVAVRQSDHLLD
jgi:hypothetical protein